MLNIDIKRLLKAIGIVLGITSIPALAIAMLVYCPVILFGSFIFCFFTGAIVAIYRDME